MCPAPTCGDAGHVATDALKDEEAAVSGGVVRSLLAPLSRSVVGLKLIASGLAAGVTLKFKYVAAVMAKKLALALKQTLTNPNRLFRRHAVSPLEFFEVQPGGVVQALRAEMSRGGVRGIVQKTWSPYVANTLVAFAMFHSYSVCSQRLLLWARLDRCEPGGGAADTAWGAVGCEAMAGVGAGLVQASLNTPLYTIRRRCFTGSPLAVSVDADRSIFGKLRDVHRQCGLRGLYQNYPYLCAQESLSLAAYFGTYELLKKHAERQAREHLDPSGRLDAFAWAAAASAAGVVLAAVGTPFENMYTWHATHERRGLCGPLWSRSVLLHFLREAPPARRRRIAFRGMGRKLPLAPLAGLPLLAYEVALHSGVAPVLHEVDEDWGQHLL